MTDMLFEKPLTTENRKHAARMVVLALVLSMDPEADKCIDAQMCPLAALPWDCGDLCGSSFDLPGRSCISWGTQSNSDVDSPSADVLDLLERAEWSARTGKVWEQWLYIQGGDGMPCNEPGTNAYDELWRAMYDVHRRVKEFEWRSHEWAEAHRFGRDETFAETKDQILTETRRQWGTWEQAVRRAQSASFKVTRPELQDDIQSARKALTRLAQIFSSPMLGNKIEEPGDHLFLRGPLRCDRVGISQYPIELVKSATTPILNLVNELTLYIDGSIPLSPSEISPHVRVFRPSNWFGQATNQALYSDLLKRAVHDERLQNSEKRSQRWMHDVDEVIGQYPQYADAIRKALEADSLG
ncbi:MAG: hypothetical protein JJ916_12180 [Phycisphaerales bacterium]|nr:hypothetical protein [Phycisphaerales bacterium]